MKRIQLKMVFRGWARNKVYAVISISSLIIGLTCSVLLLGFVMHEYNIARSVPNSERLYWMNTGGMSSLDGNIATELKGKYPEIKEICIFHDEYGSIQEEKLEKRFNLYGVSPSFTDFFHSSLIAGNLKEVFTDYSHLAISRSFALKKFGEEAPIGKTLEIKHNKNIRETNDRYNAKEIKEIFTVSAVIDDREKGFLRYDVIKRLDETDISSNLTSYRGNMYTFFRVDSPTEMKMTSDKINADSVYLKNYGMNLTFVPVNDVYFQGEDEGNGLLRSRDKSLMFIALCIALAILLISCFNYINITMTRSLQHLRNTGQQLIFGASRREIRMQLILDTFMQCLIALGIAIILIYRFVPVFNTYVGADLQPADLFTGSYWMVYALLILLITVLPSFYIFYKLGKVELNQIVKQEYKGRTRLITGIVITQFTVSAVLLIVMLNIRQQMNYVVFSRPDADRIVLVSLPGADEKLYTLFKERLSEIPEIEAKTSSAYNIDDMAVVNGKYVFGFFADKEYFSFYKMNFLQGGPFSHWKQSDEMVVNETFIKTFDLKDPLGEAFSVEGKEYRICGIIADFPVQSFKQASIPLMITNHPERWYNVTLKMQKANIVPGIAKMDKIWKEICPSAEHLTYETLADKYRDTHQGEDKMLHIVGNFTWISLLLTSIGLFGLAWFSVENRKKEVSLRKINGATETQIMSLLCGKFVKWIVWAFILGGPIAWYLTAEWMSRFVYKTDLTLWNYVGAAGFVILVGLATVCWQSWFAATRNPVETLKNE